MSTRKLSPIRSARADALAKYLSRSPDRQIPLIPEIIEALPAGWSLSELKMAANDLAVQVRAELIPSHGKVYMRLIEAEVPES